MIGKEAVLDPFADRHINMMVSSLVGRYGFTEADRDDLRQSFRLKLIESAPEYDPSKKWNAFVVVVCKNHRLSLLTHRLAEKAHTLSRDRVRVSHRRPPAKNAYRPLGAS